MINTPIVYSKDAACYRIKSKKLITAAAKNKNLDNHCNHKDIHCNHIAIFWT